MTDLLKRIFGGKPAADPAWIEPEGLVRSLHGDAPPLVIDVRTLEEFSGPLGHIDGARNIPLDQFAPHAMALVTENRPVVLVCHTDRRSAAAARMLQQAGGGDIAVLQGGMVAWRSCGL